MSESDRKGPRVPDNPEPPSSPAPATSWGQRLLHRLRSLMARTTVSLRDDLQVALDEKDSPETADFSESERLIQEALDNLARGRTVITIAHRLSTIRHADRIVVLHAGRIVEQGGFAQLSAAGGHFARLLANAEPVAKI